MTDTDHVLAESAREEQRSKKLLKRGQKSGHDRLHCPIYTCQSGNTMVTAKYQRKRDGAVVRRHRCRECGQRFQSEQRISKAA